MRGIYTPVTDIRRKVFTEVARMSYESNEMADYAKEIRDLPFKISILYTSDAADD